MIDLFLDTLQALTRPRRLVPILIVSVPLILSQHLFSIAPNADAIALAMIGLFLLFGPFSYRALFGTDGFRGSLRRYGPLSPTPWLRLLGFGLLGGLPAIFGFLVPRLLELPLSFLTYTVNLAVVAALFWVGSWGLARDVQQEQSLEEARAHAEALSREAEHARLLALEAHLDPHFLFNTLNAIAEWVREDPVYAERALLDLSALLREILEGVKRPTWPLARELDLVRAVWELHAVRDPERFIAHVDADADLPTLDVPPMVLLPLAENAVKHGPAKGHEGPLRLHARRDDGGVAVEIRNPGPYTGPRDGGEGLPIVRRRLALQYGEGATLHLSDDAGATLARLVLPGGPR